MVVQPLSGAAIQFRRDPIAVVLGEVGHALSLGQILPDQTIRVFVGAALPRMMQRREIEASAGGPLELGVLVELRAIVDRDRAHGMELRADELAGPSIHGRAHAPIELAEEQKARLALDHAQHARPILARAQHGVRLPMPERAPRIHLGGPLGDPPFAGEPPAAVVAAVALAPLLASAAQMLVERAAPLPILPDVAVDRLVANREAAVPLQPPRDLFGTPVFAHQGQDLVPLGGRKAQIAARSRPPAAGLPVGHLRAVRAVVPRAVAAHFPSDRAPVPAQDTGNGCGRVPSPSQGAEGISFGKGDLVIRHGRLLSLGGDGRLPVPRSPFSLEDGVALTI